MSKLDTPEFDLTETPMRKFSRTVGPIAGGLALVATVWFGVGGMIGASQIDNRARDAGVEASAKYNTDVEFKTNATDGWAVWPFKGAAGAGIFSIDGRELQCNYYGLRSENFSMLCATDLENPDRVAVSDLG